MSKKILILACFIAALAFVLPQAYAVNWQNDLASALKLAKSQHKPVMIDFYTEWCHWCKKLDSDTYSDPKVNEASQKFICVKIDAEKEPAIASKYGASGYPTIIFLDSNGNVLQKIPGYLPPDGFLANMNKILSTLPKPSAQNNEKPPAEAGGFVVVDNQAAGGKGKDGKTLPARTVGQEFVYNGYLQAGPEITAQINYKGTTYFLKKGENFDQFQVVSVDREKVVLASETGDMTLEYKKPHKGSGIINEISRTITQPAETRSLTDTAAIKESLPEAVSGKAITMFLSVALGILLIFYIYFSLCLQLIAGKTRTHNGWMAWVPVLSLFLALNIGNIRYRAVLIPLAIFFALIFASSLTFMLNPIIGFLLAALTFLNALYFLVITGYIWYKIAVARGKSPALAVVLSILTFVTPLNLIAIGYLAFSK